MTDSFTFRMFISIILVIALITVFEKHLPLISVAAPFVVGAVMWRWYVPAAAVGKWRAMLMTLVVTLVGVATVISG